MQPYSRPVILGAIATLMLAMGCETTVPVGVDQQLGTVVKPASVGTPSPVGIPIKGTVTNETGAAADKAHIIVTDARFMNVPNSGEADSDSAGKFALRPVPPGSVYFAVTEINGLKFAGAFAPNPRGMTDPSKISEVAITVASTIAIAGVVPFFVEDIKAPEKFVYRLTDLSLAKFNALAAAVAAAPEASTIKPSKRIKDLIAPFNLLRDKNLAVKAAYEAIFADLRSKQLLRAAGNAKVIGEPGSDSNVPLPTTSTGATPSGTPATVTPSAVASVKTITDIEVVLNAPDAANKLQTASFDPVQMAVITLPVVNGDALLIPDEKFVRIFTSTAFGNKVVDIGDEMEPKAIVTEVRTIAGSGNTLYAVGKSGGVDGLFTITVNIAPAVSYAVSFQPFTGTETFSVKHITGLALSKAGDFLYAADDQNHTILKINAANAAVNLWSGAPNITGRPVTGGTAADFKYNQPTSLAIDLDTMYIADKNNHRILKANLLDNTVAPWVGNVNTAKAASSTLANATFDTPVSIFMDVSKLYVADQNGHTVTKVDIVKEEVQIYKQTGKDKFVTFCRSVGILGNLAYTVDNSGNLATFTNL